MNIKNGAGVARVMMKKLNERHICLMDYKTNEKIAVDYELNQIIKRYYEKQLSNGY